MEIRSKRQFFDLWEAGLLGNKLRTWRDPQEAYDSGVPIVGFRQIGVAGGGKLDIIPRARIFETAAAWRAEGRDWVICEAAPDEHGTIQGEVVRRPGGLFGYLGWSCGLRMREAIARGLLTHRTPGEVQALLNTYMDASSRDDLEALLDQYPDAVVEFTCYTKPVGAFSHRNTIFWEVRNY